MRSANERRTILTVAAIAVCTLLHAEEPAAPPPAPWTMSLGAGLATTSGNTDTQSYNLSFGAVWDPKTNNIFKTDVVYLYGETDGEATVDKSTAAVRYERVLSDRWFAFGQISYLRDPFKDIDYLVAPTVGAGYHVVKTEKSNLLFDASVGGLFEKEEGVSSDSSISYSLGEAWEWAITPNSKLLQRARGLWKADDMSDAFYHFDAGVSAAIAKSLELKVLYTLDYRNEPTDPTIEKDDSALVVALVYKM